MSQRVPGTAIASPYLNNIVYQEKYETKSNYGCRYRLRRCSCHVLAGYHPNMELVAVLPVHGNAPLTQTLDNTLRLLCAASWNTCRFIPAPVNR
jgi:hypothetical protein